MTTFDSLCDATGWTRAADPEAMWRATMDVALAQPVVALQADVEPAVCPICEGSGWECYGLGFADPHFRECGECGNPHKWPSP
jgi:hypothetical protein